MKNDHIYVYMKEPAVHVLGPGCRFVLWVQGCRKKCPGCVAENARIMEEGTLVEVSALALEIALSDADGLTISGGEPFLQSAALANLIDQIRKYRDMGIIVYTGYLYEELLKDADAQRLLDRIDLLIDGSYVRKLDDGGSLRGSSNQRMILLTDRYKEMNSEYGRQARKKEFFYHGSHVHEIGIPDNRKK